MIIFVLTMLRPVLAKNLFAPHGRHIIIPSMQGVTFVDFVFFYHFKAVRKTFGVVNEPRFFVAEISLHFPIGGNIFKAFPQIRFNVAFHNTILSIHKHFL